MDRLDAMRLFVRVAELGSFAAAAKQYGVARSVVTRQVAALEGRLGAKLMVRSTRSLSMTSAGTVSLEMDYTDRRADLVEEGFERNSRPRSSACTRFCPARGTCRTGCAS